MTFVGREQKLKDLHARLQSGSRLAITAISGMGGIGKTELALQYAIAQFQSGYYPGGIYWLRARGQEIATQITTFAQMNLRLTLPEGEIDKQIQHCWQYWPEGDVLVVIDDVTDYGAIKPHLPPSDSRFKLLITTRLNFGRSVENFAIEELDEESALAMVEGIVADGRIQAQLADAKALCQWVGCLPLRLELVGRYLADDLDLSVQELLAELEETRLDAEALQAVEAGMTADLGVIQALELSWRELSGLERDLACLLGMFAVAPIPWALVEKCLAEVDAKNLRKARQNGLLHRSLLKRVGDNLYQLHQIVQEFFRVKLNQQIKQGDAIKSSFCGVLVEVAQSIEYSLTLAQANDVRGAIIHLEELANCWADSLNDEALKEPFTGLGYFYKGQGIYVLALSWYLDCLKQTQNRFGETHPDVAASMDNLANLYSVQGKYRAAEPMHVKALAMRKQLLGETHPSAATSLNNLANLYYHQGKYAAAELLYVEALAMCKQLLGRAHPNVVTSLNNLAHLYNVQGKYEAAEPLYTQALAIGEQLLGEAHPSMATSRCNLGVLYHEQESYYLSVVL
ncbi:tetratricopeptide repeat protein [Leptolyngbya sp. BC1307]|uniref:tetratricopeptide repeat protein n=1 Tax=Leptolyngbya sp. BC1307 TaxID=2029589 RepID=UPI001F0AA529|nr:tetratricopeptide repeat protein [Leptolyngbya sp. BC1307]